MILSGYKTKLVKNILLVAFFLFFGKLISLAREIYFSYQYGSNYIVESFFFNFNIINLIGGILLNTIIFYLVPLVYKNINKDSQINEDFIIRTFNLFFCIGLVFQIIIFLVFYIGFNFNLFSLSESVKEIAQKNYLIFCFVFPFLTMTYTLTSFLTTRNKHISLFYESIPSLIMLISVISFHSNIYILSTSFSLGVLLQFIILLFHNGIVKTSIIKKILSFKILDLNRIFFIILLIQIIFALPNFIDHFIVSSFPQKSLAHFTYANKIYSIVYTIVFILVSRTLITFFLDSNNEITKGFIFYILISFGVGILISSALYYFSYEITFMLFERGSFSGMDTAIVSGLFRHFTFLVPFYLVKIIFITYFYGKRELDIVFKLLATILLTKCLYLVLLDKVIISELIISTLIGFIVGSFYIANILKIKYKSYAHDIK
jgi:putative peptidoglycan lipid II flippase